MGNAVATLRAIREVNTEVIAGVLSPPGCTTRPIILPEILDLDGKGISHLGGSDQERLWTASFRDQHLFIWSRGWGGGGHVEACYMHREIHSRRGENPQVVN
jgi:hypothetical protein